MEIEDAGKERLFLENLLVITCMHGGGVCAWHGSEGIGRGQRH